ncbi:MAG: hypothetical protein IJA06_03790 [Oscillospiraceae bacterium]|nr:hypothetical protein [Oscillospiraceae bacterium]MBQ3560922.1 hypothetical protein [Oscillospiraceae bacterium]
MDIISYVMGVEAGKKAAGNGTKIELLENVSIPVDFSNGNQFVEVPDGQAVKSAVIQKPTNLVAENIAEGVDIAGIVGTHSGGSSGGSVEGVHFVTFMSEDGTTELYKRPVADGDDCADPVIRGLIAEPEKESTAQYAYTHAGWSASPNGALDSNILKAVKADKTVYANFAAVLRYYTITYYDSDGTTVLKTESLAYGTMPSYKAEKEGFFFNGWSPQLTTVKADASYTALWTETITFAKGTWADIARISEAGEAEQYFKLGDSRTISIGSGKTLTFEIIGFNHDDLADGSGKAGLTIATKTVRGSTYARSEQNSQMSTICNSGFPAELTSIIKPVTKLYNSQGAETINSTTYSKGFSLSASEINVMTGADSQTGVVNLGETYAYYLQNPDAIKHKKQGGGTAYYSYWLRDWNTKVKNTGSSADYLGICYKNGTTVEKAGVTAYHELIFGFCI